MQYFWLWYFVAFFPYIVLHSIQNVPHGFLLSQTLIPIFRNNFINSVVPLVVDLFINIYSIWYMHIDKSVDGYYNPWSFIDIQVSSMITCKQQHSNQFAKYDLRHVIAIALMGKLKAKGEDKWSDPNHIHSTGRHRCTWSIMKY